jgi:hypothetical protein
VKYEGNFCTSKLQWELEWALKWEGKVERAIVNKGPSLLGVVKGCVTVKVYAVQALWLVAAAALLRG